jgi:hypothetical protein
MMAIILMSIHIRTSAPSAFWTARLAVAEAINQAITRTPEIGQRIGAFWPGALAYFSKAPIAPLDGIISSNEYLEKYLKPGRQLEYGLERGIDNFVVFLTPRQLELIRSGQVPTRLKWSWDYVRLLARGDMEIEVKGVWPTLSGKADSASWYWLRIHRKDQSVSAVIDNRRF